ncbi:conserved hypothetical protein [Ricinus communis]|uniref:Uncharacterized protein n=1 Tax=Ricinus communis TaxID=3988 RepID=B9SRV5_RICCO|nr:conserved hypothetical protein [Ricinus communis]
MARQRQLLVVVSTFALIVGGLFSCGVCYTRPPPRENIYVQQIEKDDDSTPQQKN